MTSLQEIDGYRDGSLHDYVSALGRQKVIFLVAAVLVPAVALLLSMAQQPSYQASAQVLITGLSSSPNADRVAETEVSVARIPLMASRVLHVVNVHGLTAADLLAHSSVVANPNADVLDFSVTDREPLVARRLVNAYVRQFTAYQAGLDATPLGMPGVRVLDTAISASKISPRPKLYLLLGVILGLVLGLGLAVLADALDTHVRSPAEVAKALGLPLLGLVPPLRSSESDGTKLAILGDPNSAGAQAVRMLKTNLVVATAAPPAHVIVFTSASEDDGKSELVANLAVSLARAHRRVILVDFDFLHPMLPGLFGATAPRGLTDVVSGSASLYEALAPADVAQDGPHTSQGRVGKRGGRRSLRLRQRRAAEAKDANPRSHPAVGGKRGSAWLDTALADWDSTGFNADHRGELQILFSGSVSSGDYELVDAEIVPKIIDDLRSVSDLVLVNAPPLLRASDGIMLATMVDAIAVVASARHARRSELKQLGRVLATLPPPKLGVILTDVKKRRADFASVSGLAPQASLGSVAAVSARRTDAPASL